MLYQINVFFMIEIIGTIAFAVSGGMLAIRKNLDLLGIIVLGVTTACGGGMLRDLLLGITPPSLFINPVYVTAATIAVLALFLAVRYLKLSLAVLESERYDNLLNLMDAIGLGAFTVVGIDTAIEAGFYEYRLLIIIMGVLTGVGGGVLRDIMATETPGILKKHIYACASLAGAVSYVLFLPLSNDLAMIFSAVLVVIIRILARKYRWNLPRAM